MDDYEVPMGWPQFFIAVFCTAVALAGGVMLAKYMGW